MINEIRLIGNVGRDPESKTFPGGSSICEFSLATTENFKKKGSDDWQKVTQWHNIVIWGKLGEFAQTKVHKGDLVTVSGKVVYEEYTDKENVKRKATKIIADSFRVLKTDNAAGSSTQQPHHEEAATGDNGSSFDDLPF